MDPEAVYLQNLERIAAFVVWREHLNADEMESSRRSCAVRLPDDVYAIIRRIEGRSSISTYLTTVILRIYDLSRVERWGEVAAICGSEASRR